jgi:hypothetical protein
VFSPFINSDGPRPKIGRNHHRDRLAHIIYQTIDQFGPVFDSGHAGEDFCAYDDGLLHAERDALIKSKAPKTIFKSDQYLPCMAAFVRTAQRRSALKKQLCKNNNHGQDAK